MAISCTAESLATNASTYAGLGGMQTVVQTYLLIQMAFNAGAIASTDPKVIEKAAAAYKGIPEGMQLAVQLYLLCQLVNK
jgi:hypothetical protein